MTTTPATRLAPAKVKTYPVIEIFGPTIQGEGAEAGLPTHFLRVGGCDYRCSWCDTMYAVDPAEVRANARHLSCEQIIAEIDALAGAPEWVTISGGNPALHELGPVVDDLHRVGYRVAVETQGSMWRDWLATVERLTISPKPPNSDMATARHKRQFERFLAKATQLERGRLSLKIVCFDDIDLAWATERADEWRDIQLFLSVGTPAPTGDDVRDVVGDRYRWLCEAVAGEPRLRAARVLPQLHVIAWKGATAV